MTEQDTPKMTHDEMIDALKGLVFGTFDRTTAKEREALDMAISALSKNKGEWIPVSERLPEKNVWVLVTVEQQIGNRYQEIMRRHIYRDAWTDNIDNYTDIITAWMPLPEPYKAEKGGE